MTSLASFIIIMPPRLHALHRCCLMLQLLHIFICCPNADLSNTLKTRSTQRAQTSADPDFGLWTPRSEA